MRALARPSLFALSLPALVVSALLSSLVLAEEQPEPVALTSAEDHQRLLDVLGIESLRPGASGDPSSPNAANYDEAKANQRLSTLPPVLETESGETVTTAEQWWGERRPELLEVFATEIYGRPPSEPPAVAWVVDERRTTKVGAVPVEQSELTGVADNSHYPAISVAMDVTVTLPKSEEPVPVMIALTLSPETMARFTANLSDEQREAFEQAANQWKHQLLEAGWGYAELIATSVQADEGAGLTRGIIGLTNRGQPRGLSDWGALRAWAWGTSRVLDYLESLAAVDAGRIGVHGHSRYGKAALVAMAFDRRFAIGYISSSGEAGAKLWRRHYGEQVGNIASPQLYHWMAGRFLQYAGPKDVEDLPVDAHQLIALSAPRPLFIGAGLEGDQWVDPKGSFLAARYAQPVYKLLGEKGLSQTDYPEVGEAVTGGQLGFRQHSGGHTPGPNWPTFIEFAQDRLE